MSTDKDIFQGVGEVLVAISPADAEVVLLTAEVSLEGDHCKLLFDYVDQAGVKQWFMPSSAKADSDLLDLFCKLRRHFESNGLYAGGKPWRGCVVELSLRSMKFQINFMYD